MRQNPATFPFTALELEMTVSLSDPNYVCMLHWADHRAESNYQDKQSEAERGSRMEAQARSTLQLQCWID